jgi:hypothetical protein
MATYEEVATLASDINQKLGTTIQPDSLVFLIESYIEEEDVPFTDIPISEIEEQVLGLLLVADAFVAAQDGDSIEEIEAILEDTAEVLGVEL